MGTIVELGRIIRFICLAILGLAIVVLVGFVALMAFSLVYATFFC